MFSIWYFWDATFWYKLIANFILILGTPALSDLFKPYDKYRKEWVTKYEDSKEVHKLERGGTHLE